MYGAATAAVAAAALALAPWPAALIGHLYPGARVARPRVTPHLTGIWTGRSYAYLLMPTTDATRAGAAVLIDAGSDPRGLAILQALAATGCTPACVGTVLLTHGHGDHTAGLDLFAHAQVMAHPADGALLRGDVGPRSWAMRTAMRLAPRQRHGLHTADLCAGQVLRLGGHEMAVVGLPGHTDGSVGYLLAGGLVAGDAVVATSLNAPALRPLSWRLADQAEAVGPVLRRLDAAQLAWVADGHTGVARRTDH